MFDILGPKYIRSKFDFQCTKGDLPFLPSPTMGCPINNKYILLNNINYAFGEYYQ